MVGIEEKSEYKDQFIEYYEQYNDDIFRFCMVKTRDRSLSLDITQETFMKFWEYIIKGTDIKNERPLLYRIANNLIIDQYRKKKEILVDDFTAGEYEHHVRDEQEQKLSDKIDAEKIIDLLHKLPDLTREILTLRFVNDFSISEIAQTVKRDNKTVSVYLHRGIKQLRNLVQDYE